MEIHELISVIRRGIFFIIACVVIAGGFAAYKIATTSQTFTATAAAYVRVASETGDGTANSPGALYSASLLASQKVKAFAPLFESVAVSNRVVDDLDLPMKGYQLANRISVKNDENSLVISVSATMDTADLARKVADAVVEATSSEVSRLEGEDSAVALILMTSSELSPVSKEPNYLLIIGVDIALGFIAGCAISFLKNFFDKKLRTPEDIETKFNHPILAVVPHSPRLASFTGLRAPVELESIRKLRTNLRYTNIDNPPKVILVTSSAASDGKSLVARTLAIVLANAGSNVVLIDGDLRKPTVAKMFGFHSKKGLAQVLSGTVPLSDAFFTTGTEGLYLLPAGDLPPNPSEILGSERMKELVGAFATNYTVIIDAPPVLPVTDAAVLAALADTVVVVAKANDTRSDQLQSCLDQLTQSKASIAGIVLNDVVLNKVGSLKYGGSYSYGYGYGYGHAGDSKK